MSDLFGDAVKHGGSLILAVRQGTRLAYVQAETIAELRAGNARKGWKLYNLSWYDAFTLTGSGYNWQIVAGFSNAFFLDDGLGFLPWSRLSGIPDFVTDEELRGRESDRYASYTNAFIAAGYRRGAMSSSPNRPARPPTPTPSDNLIFPTALPTGSSPYRPFCGPTATRMRWHGLPNRRRPTIRRGKCSISRCGDYPQAHVQVTLTSNGTLVGAGDAAYIWATATWDEVEDIPDVVDYGIIF